MLRITFRFSLLLLSFVINQTAGFYDYYVDISNDGPAVIGANITFTAKLFTTDGKKPTGHYKYRWRDNLNPQHYSEFLSDAESTWNVNYPVEKYKPGIHLVEVSVYTEKIIIDWPLCNGRKSFKLTELLNGNLTLKQNNTIENTQYISNSIEVLHTIELNIPDANFLKYNFSSVTTVWYIDCNYSGSTSDLSFRYNYTTADVSHHIIALVYASSNSPPNVTYMTSNDSTRENLNVATTPSDVHLNSITDSSNSPRFSYLTVNNATKSNGSLPDVQFDCLNEKIINRTLNATYGLFSRKIEVKAPVANVTTDGNTWLKHGDMLNLQILCQGSGPFKACYHYQVGYYNKTGNESCDYELVMATCNFSCTRYFPIPNHYSLIVIVRNDINKIVRSIGIDVYEVTKNPQLSIIIVPVAASIVAVILIIFGIAYFIQSRNRFIVEVANFDFSMNANDMEYKTFRERLMEAIHNAFDKTEEFYEQDSTNGVPSTSKKYGSMQ